jgi:hypothetical protein
MISNRVTIGLTCITLSLVFPLLSSAQSDEFFTSDELRLIALNPVAGPGETGFLEPPIAIKHVDQGGSPELVGNFQVIDILDAVPGTTSQPLTVVDLVANTAIRLTPQNPDGTTNSLGPSVFRSPSIRTSDGQFLLFPTANDNLDPVNDNLNVTVFTDTNSDRYRSEITGQLNSDGMALADVRIETTFPDPPIGSTTVHVASSISFLKDVSLANVAGFHPDNDRLRMATVSSSFIGALPDGSVHPDGTPLPNGSTSFDTNFIRFEGVNGDIQTIDLATAARTDATMLNFLLGDGAVEIGAWVEFLKTEPDSINPSSPSLRIDIDNKYGQRIALQGILFDTDDPRDDSLQVWFERLDTPDVVEGDTTYQFDYSITATAVPEPMSLVIWVVIGSVAMCISWLGGRRKRSAAVR